MDKTQSTQKTVELSGEVNNNVVINEPFHQLIRIHAIIIGGILDNMCDQNH